MNQTELPDSFKRFDLNSLVLTGSVSALFLIITFFTTGLRSDHLVLLVICILCYYGHPLTRKFIIGFFVFVVFWIIYDSMKAYPNYVYNQVHIREPYLLEKKLFGVWHSESLLTPNEYFKVKPNTILDIITGLFYLNWMPIPLIFAFYLWIKDKLIFLHFSYAFLLTNLIGFIIYYLYPAAPPWYVEIYGFSENFQISGNVAGLARFDDYFGISLFKSIYAKGSNVFAAIPSLHSSYPVVVLYYGIKKKLGWINILLLIFVFGIWFSAVYLRHHYIIDVILGALCAVFGIWVFEKLILKNNKGKKWFEKLSERI